MFYNLQFYLQHVLQFTILPTCFTIYNFTYMFYNLQFYLHVLQFNNTVHVYTQVILPIFKISV